MATSTALKRRAKGAGPGRSLRGGKPGSPAKGGGARPVNAGKRAKPNPVLLAGLALVAVAGLAKVAMPGLFGGGTSAVASFPAPVINRHFGHAVTTTTAAPTGPAGATGRPAWSPFTPPPGFGS
jgi:hypothetical protein